MKNKFKALEKLNQDRRSKVSLLIITIVSIIGFTMFSCGSGGRLTITGLDKYNGKYAIAVSFADDYPYTIAAKSVNHSTTIKSQLENSSVVLTGGQIVNGSVTLNVYQLTSDDKTSDYNGSEEKEFNVLITNVAIYQDSSDFFDFLDVSATFKKGKARGEFTDE